MGSYLTNQFILFSIDTQFEAENNVNINVNNTQAPIISLHNSSKVNRVILFLF